MATPARKPGTVTGSRAYVILTHTHCPPMSKTRKPRIQRTDLVEGATLVLKKDGSIYTVGAPSHGQQQAAAGSGPPVKWSASYFSTYGTRSVSSKYSSYSPTTLASARFYFELPPAQLDAEQLEQLRALATTNEATDETAAEVQALAKKLLAANLLAGGLVRQPSGKS